MGKQRVRRSRDEWARLVGEQRDSGLSAKRWCEANDIGYVSFTKWRHRFELEDQGPGAAVKFVEVTPAPMTSTDGWLIDLELGNGVHLRITRGA